MFLCLGLTGRFFAFIIKTVSDIAAIKTRNLLSLQIKGEKNEGFAF